MIGADCPRVPWAPGLSECPSPFLPGIPGTASVPGSSCLVISILTVPAPPFSSSPAFSYVWGEGKNGH